VNISQPKLVSEKFDDDDDDDDDDDNNNNNNMRFSGKVCSRIMNKKCLVSDPYSCKIN